MGTLLLCSLHFLVSRHVIHRSPLLCRARRLGDPGTDPSDSAREEADPSLSVADVRAARPVQVNPASPDSQLAAAPGSFGGTGADRLGLCAAVLHATEHSTPRDRCSRGGRAAGPELQHGVRRSLATRARRSHRGYQRPGAGRSGLGRTVRLGRGDRDSLGGGERSRAAGGGSGRCRAFGRGDSIRAGVEGGREHSCRVATPSP